MKHFRKWLLITAVTMASVGVMPGFQNSVMACPGCKAANETDSRLPRAYMYSILFMLGMPATVFTGFGISFYRLSRQQQQRAEAETAAAIAEKSLHVD